MERTKKANPDTIRWVKQGGGSLRLNGRIIKPGQRFDARLDDIPEAFRDVIIPLDKLPVEPEDNLAAVPAEYKLKQRGTTTWYDVVNSKGKALNEKAMHRTDALDLIKVL